MKKVMNRRMKINKIGYILIILMLYSFIKYLLIGGFVKNIGYIIPLVVYPLMFIIAYDTIDTKEKLQKVIKVICFGFFFICIYALLQYVFGIEKVCIPGLTVNLSDYTTYGANWYLQKNNNNSSEIGNTSFEEFVKNIYSEKNRMFAIEEIDINSIAKAWKETFEFLKSKRK